MIEASLVELLTIYRELGIEKTLDFGKYNLIAISHHSTAIEGATLTENEARLLLDEGLTPASKPLLHSLMVKDHFEALKFVLEQAHVNMPPSVGFICEIAGRVLKSTGSVYETLEGKIDSTRGEFRKGSVRVGNHYFPAHSKVPSLVDRLIGDIHAAMRRELSLLEQAYLSFDAHFHLVSIHPFYDGNGRTSRLLMNAIQHYYGLPLVIVPIESRSGYFQALDATREKEDVGIFREFMLGLYCQQLSKEITRFQTMQKGEDGYSEVFQN